MQAQPTEKERKKRKVLFWIWLVCWLGLGFSIELARVDFLALKNPDFNPVCKISERMDCVAVALSPYSKIFGIHNSVYGIVGYFLLLVLIPLRLKTKIRIFAHLENYLFILALIFLGISIYLALVSTFKLHTFCLWCTCVYVVNLGFFILSIFTLDSPFLIFRQFLEDFELVRGDPRVLISIVMIVILVVIGFLIQLNRLQAKKLARVRAFLKNQAVELEFPNDPCIGPYDAPVTIIEFSDFQCPFCRRMHYVLKKMREKFGPRIRLIYKNFPLDAECNYAVRHSLHPGSCLAAYAAECAYQLGCFKEFYEKLIRAGAYSEASLLTMAAEYGIDPEKFSACLKSEQTKKAVQKDIDDALKLKIKGTPMLVVNGKIINGYIDEDKMELVIKALLKGIKPRR